MTVKNDLPGFQQAVKDMDRLSQEGLSQICAVASLAISHIEHGAKNRQQMEEIRSGLEVIRDKSEDIQSLISFEAEQVGCSYRRESKVARFDCAKELYR